MIPHYLRTIASIARPWLDEPVQQMEAFDVTGRQTMVGSVLVVR
jgi:hypothetical protein